MVTPLNSPILDEIEARFYNASVENEYSVRFKRIKRARLKPFKGQDLPAINYWMTSLTSDTTKYNKDERSTTLFVEAHTKVTETPFIDTCDILACDVVTSLYRTTLAPKVSDAEDDDLKGLVKRFKFAGYDYQIGEGQKPFCGVLVRFSITYLTVTNNMYS